jgi:predicted transcriptional regulator
MTPNDLLRNIQKQLAAANLTDISKRSGVAYNTVRQVKDGTGNPTISVLHKIQEALSYAA